MGQPYYENSYSYDPFYDPIVYSSIPPPEPSQGMAPIPQRPLLDITTQELGNISILSQIDPIVAAAQSGDFTQAVDSVSGLGIFASGLRAGLGKTLGNISGITTTQVHHYLLSVRQGNSRLFSYTRKIIESKPYKWVKGLGTSLTVAITGWNVYQTFTDSGLSTPEKFGMAGYQIGGAVFIYGAGTAGSATPLGPVGGVAFAVGAASIVEVGKQKLSFWMKRN